MPTAIPNDQRQPQQIERREIASVTGTIQALLAESVQRHAETETAWRRSMRIARAHAHHITAHPLGRPRSDSTRGHGDDHTPDSRSAQPGERRSRRSRGQANRSRRQCPTHPRSRYATTTAIPARINHRKQQERAEHKPANPTIRHVEWSWDARIGQRLPQPRGDAAKSSAPISRTATKHYPTGSHRCDAPRCANRRNALS